MENQWVCTCNLALRVHVHNAWIPGVLVLVLVVQGLSMYMIIGYLDPLGIIVL